MITDRRLRHLFWLGAELGAALLLALALFVIVVRVALPQVGEFKPQIERWASDALGQEVRIGAVAAYWPGLDLTVVLDRVAVLGAGNRPELEFSRAHLDLDLLASLWRRQPVVNELNLDGLTLQVVAGSGGVTLAGGTASGESAAPSGALRLLSWLLGQERLDLTSGRLLWQGDAAGAPRFDRFSLRARNAGPWHQLAVHLAAGGDPGALDLAAEFRGPAGDPARWRGQFYLNGQGVAWQPLAALAAAQFPELAGRLRVAGDLPPRADGELWGDFAAEAVTRLVGVAKLNRAHDPAPRALDHLSVRFDAQPDAAGWRADFGRLELQPSGAERLWLGPGSVRLGRDVAGAVTVEVGLTSLDLTDLQQLAAAADLLPEALAGMVEGMQPRGRIHDLRGRWQAGAGDVPPRWRVAGEAWDVALTQWGKWPGVDNLRLRFDAEPDRSRIDLDSRNARVTLPGLFREPLQIDRLSGAVTVAATPAGWVVRAPDLAAINDHIATRSRLELRLPAAGGAPWVDLAVGYRDGTAAEAWRYLPVGIMSKKVVAWLDHALVGGHVVRGGMLLHGPLDRFPFDDGDGRFQVRFLVDDVTLDYLEGWPRIEEIAAWVGFDGRGMTIDGQLARIFDARIEGVTARVADLTVKGAPLVIAGRVVGAAGDGLRYLRESPLRARFGDYLAVAQGQGGLRLGLRLAIPLGPGQTAVSGRIDLDDVVLDLPEFAMRLEQASGRLDFTSATLQGSGLRAIWRGMPVTLDVGVPERGAGARGGPRISARGVATAAQFDDLLPAVLRPRLGGELAWQAIVSVREATGGKVDRVDIALASDLAGVAVDLPAPLGKPPERARPLRVDLELAGAARPRLRASYGDLALAAELELATGAVDVARAELRLATGAAVLPEARLWRGDVRLDAAAFAAWRELLQPLAAAAPAATQAPPLELRLRLDAFPLGTALTLHQVDATVHRSDAAWQIDLLSREAEGRVTLPRQAERQEPVVAEFSRLALEYDFDRDAPGAGAAADDDPDRTDPRTLPAARVDIRSLVLNGDDLGALSLVAEPYADGLRLPRLRLDDEQWNLLGSGRWSRTAAGEESAIDFTLETSNLDRLDRALGFDSQLEVSAAEYRLGLRWPGAPSDFALATLSGSIYGKLTDGVLREVEPGIGRVFSLVNLRQLGRRLTLDFSDLFGRGMQFDAITGNFTLDRGDAYTNDLLIQTSSATVNIMGRTGLADRDYDQLMTVLPHFSGTLPLAGAVLGGPVVGAALLLFNQLFADKVDELSRVQYRITGPWADPVVERITAEPSSPPATGGAPQTD